MIWLLQVLLEASIRATVVALVVGLILAVARVRSSSLRHTAWLGVLCAMMLMPVLPHIVPGVQAPVAIPSISDEVVAAVPETLPPVVDVPQAIPASPAPRDWLGIVMFGLYAAGTLTLACRLIAGWFVTRSVVRSSTPIPGQKVPLFESTRIATPVTAGIFAPKVLLPLNWRRWPEEKLRAVLAHELAHLQRHDTLTSLLAHLNRCVFWFHPLSWWLQRKLALTAECACDDAAIRTTAESRKYAEMLLDMAEAMRRSGRRLSWQALGVDGSGVLGHRIDRILRGGPFTAATRSRTLAIAVSSAIVILVVAACREKSAPPLKEDPALAKVRAEGKQYAERRQAIEQMGAEQASDLEQHLKDHPDDLDARKNLMSFYQTSGRKLLGDKKTIEVLRPHMLWFIRNHPEDGYAMLASPSDPIGYEEKRKLWLAVAGRKDAPPEAIFHAAQFFMKPDPQFSEKLYLRARAGDPHLPGTRWMGTLYASVLTGPLAHSPYGEEVRKRLDQSSDPGLLEATGMSLERNGGLPGKGSERLALAQSCLERAHQLNPQSNAVHVELLILKRRDLFLRILPIQKLEPLEKWYPAVAALSETDRFHFLPDLAENAYWRGESLDHNKHDRQGARAAWEVARRFAGDALRLASKYRNDANYGTAIHKSNMTMGTVAMRVDGDKRSATRYLLEAAKAPATDELRYLADGLDLKLPVALLRYGGADERAAVIAYLEQYGKIVQRRDVDYLQAAQQLRQGYMPIWYEAQAAQLK